MTTRIMAVLNQKGGVGKTTTCVNLGAGLARSGQRVLLIDLDPQANLTVHMGLEPHRQGRNSYSLLLGEHGIAQAVRESATPGLLVLPSTLALANAEIQLASTVGRELVLREAIESWNREADPEESPAEGELLGGAPQRGEQAPARPLVDFILIDCPPSLGILTMNALCAASEVVLPIQTEFFALQGVAGILESLKAVQRLNRGLRLSMVVPCLVDRRTTLARDVLAEVRSYFADMVTKTEIRVNVKLAEAPSHGKTIFEYEPRCNGALDYASLAQEVLGEAVVVEDGPAPTEQTASEQTATEQTTTAAPVPDAAPAPAVVSTPVVPSQAVPPQVAPEPLPEPVAAEPAPASGIRYPAAVEAEIEMAPRAAEPIDAPTPVPEAGESRAGESRAGESRFEAPPEPAPIDEIRIERAALAPPPVVEPVSVATPPASTQDAPSASQTPTSQTPTSQTPAAQTPAAPHASPPQASPPHTSSAHEASQGQGNGNGNGNGGFASRGPVWEDEVPPPLHGGGGASNDPGIVLPGAGSGVVFSSPPPATSVLPTAAPPAAGLPTIAPLSDVGTRVPETGSFPHDATPGNAGAGSPDSIPPTPRPPR